MTLNFKDSQNEIINTIKNNNIIKFIFGNIFTISFIIVLLLFIIIINNININVDNNNKLKYSYNMSSIIIYSLIASIISLSIHDNLIKEEYINKFKSKSELEFTDMMIGSAENLIKQKPISSNGIEDDIERFLNKS